MKKRILSIITVVSIFTFLLTGCLVPSTTPPSTVLNLTSTTTQIIPPNSANGLVSGFEATLESIYSRVNPSVVNIQVVFLHKVH